MQRFLRASARCILTAVCFLGTVLPLAAEVQTSPEITCGLQRLTPSNPNQSRRIERAAIECHFTAKPHEDVAVKLPFQLPYEYYFLGIVKDTDVAGSQVTLNNKGER